MAEEEEPPLNETRGRHQQLHLSRLRRVKTMAGEGKRLILRTALAHRPLPGTIKSREGATEALRLTLASPHTAPRCNSSCCDLFRRRESILKARDGDSNGRAKLMIDDIRRTLGEREEYILGERISWVNGRWKKKNLFLANSEKKNNLPSD